MDSGIGFVTPLSKAIAVEPRFIGGKSAHLARLQQTGIRVPDGFCITTEAYGQFLRQGNLIGVIRVELGRKPFKDMRWEEMWDAALRIRSAFLATGIPAEIEQSVGIALKEIGPNRPMAVRSSAPGEDSANRSFAGLHESYVGVVGTRAVLDSIRLVWASLWSDAALLYRQELSLDPAESKMAVLVQTMVDEVPSGVAFGRDPRNVALDRAVVEAVPGPCSDLVDGLVDPDHWDLERSSGRVVKWRPGEREKGSEMAPLLQSQDLDRLGRALHQVESIFGWPPDVEWTGREDQFHLLQARPITTLAPASSDERQWYLSLRPSVKRMRVLRQRVVEELIPELATLGERLAVQDLDSLDDGQLAGQVRERVSALDRWKAIYRDDFIPFAHGVRQLGQYYNDAVRPDDPYEFVGLLKGEKMLALERNRQLEVLAGMVRSNDKLWNYLDGVVQSAKDERIEPGQLELIQRIQGGSEFFQTFGELQGGLMDVVYGHERLSERPDILLQSILGVARSPKGQVVRADEGQSGQTQVAQLENSLFSALRPERRDEAEEMLELGRVSWRLRDEDNVLMGRLESQCLRAIQLAADRLRMGGRLLPDGRIGLNAGLILADALSDPGGGKVILPPEPDEPITAGKRNAGASSRQMVGQPAAPGLASGKARLVRTSADLAAFVSGEVLICDAIQPTMTHLVPLAGAVVERRGGMLIHGAIIAREMGIPCVNGISNLLDLLENGDLVTVDGYLGIVSVGEPEFSLEGGS